MYHWPQIINKYAYVGDYNYNVAQKTQSGGSLHSLHHVAYTWSMTKHNESGGHMNSSEPSHYQLLGLNTKRSLQADFFGGRHPEQ